MPRLINLICDRALLGAYVQGKDKVDKATLKKAAQEVFGKRKESGQSLKAVAWIAAGIFLLVSVATIATFSYQNFAQPEPLPVSEVQKKSQVLPPVTLQWPPDRPIERSEEMAFQALFKQWGSSYKVIEKNAVCSQAASEGLQCLKELSDLKRLIGMNRPSVLKLFDDKGNSFYALLKSAQGQSITLILADRDLTIDVREMEKKWLGEYTLFWKVPLSWHGKIQPGEAGRHLQWLAQLMAKRTGDSRFALKVTYDKEMVKEIKKFQVEEGLLPDGIVGVHTAIHLQSHYGVGEPLLSKGSEGI